MNVLQKSSKFSFNKHYNTVYLEDEVAGSRICGVLSQFRQHIVGVEVDITFGLIRV
jgi:hypothetical protein